MLLQRIGLQKSDRVLVVRGQCNSMRCYGDLNSIRRFETDEANVKQSRGFTLIEMAVVVTIAAILLTLGVKGMTSMLSSTQRSATQDNLNGVRNALLAYFAANHRFPCPDTGPVAGRDGVEDRTTAGNPTTTCAAGASPGAGIGTVPYSTLGLTRAQALDGYGNFITYRVDVTLKAPAAYIATTAYGTGDLITSGGVVYRSLSNNNLGHAPPPAVNTLPHSSAINYKAGDMVTNANVAYRALLPNVNHVPPLAGDADWEVASAVYNAAVQYSIGDFVTNAAGTILYRSIANNNIGNAVGNALFWMTPANHWGPLPATSGNTWYRATPANPQLNCGRNIAGGLSVFSAAAPGAGVSETTTAVVVLISHGANGLGAWLPGGPAASQNNPALAVQPELGNTQLAPLAPTGYRDYPFSSIAATPFDDMVVFIDSTPSTTEATGAIKTYMSSTGRVDICH